ncbi:NAD(P)-dependent oxidoreductase [Aurantibacillus circumpalustris]|uniref:NAD(P)-dependent oxidoreductase n=1 Tax=Aurantibacillus circumpalustris TaxID=3036359 RepID=UPI00295B4B26|nr:NAD(P)-dependent oxidoreductase [Aurantibacillus circumpalustris]
MEKFKIGVLREEKSPPDKRVPLTPLICSELIRQYPNVEIVVQPSKIRCYSDDEYTSFGIPLQEDLNDCDILMGVKEVPVEKLIAKKKYFFFSHTIKKQPHNKKLIKGLIEKKIQMIDYETLTDKHNNRIIGFGRYAGIVGAYNGILGYGLKYDLFRLKPANQCRDRAEMEEELKRAKLPNIKIAITGGGRVANGAIETLSTLKIRKVTSDEFIMATFREPVYCQLNPRDYVERPNDHNFDLNDFFTHPEHFVSKFPPFTKVTDLYISTHYWDPRSPKMFSKKDMKADNFRMSVIADVTCDIDGSVPTTIRASTIAQPFYGYNIKTEKEDLPFTQDTICIMAVDNLPCELPRNASDDFGKDLSERVLPFVFGNDKDKTIKRASICKDGKLTHNYEYLSDYAYT